MIIIDNFKKDLYCLETLEGQEWTIKATVAEIENHFADWVNLINHRIVQNGKDISKRFKIKK